MTQKKKFAFVRKDVFFFFFFCRSPLFAFLTGGGGQFVIFSFTPFPLTLFQPPRTGRMLLFRLFLEKKKNFHLYTSPLPRYSLSPLIPSSSFQHQTHHNYSMLLTCHLTFSLIIMYV